MLMLAVIVAVICAAGCQREGLARVTAVDVEGQPVPALGFSEHLLGRAWSVLDGETDERGELQVHVVGEMEVRPRGLRGRPASVTLRPGTEVGFVFPRLCELSVRVELPGGEPLEGGAVGARTEPAGWPLSEVGGEESSPGSFEARLPCGDVTLAVAGGDEHAHVRRELSVEEDAELTVALVRGEEVEIEVVDEDGAPLRGVVIGEGHFMAALADDAGRASVRLDPSASHVLDVVAQRHPFGAEGPARASLEIRAEEPYTPRRVTLPVR